MKITAHIVNNATGETRLYETEVPDQYVKTQAFWWSRWNGNAGCDCNRGDFWHGDEEDHDYPCGYELFSVPYIVFEDGTKVMIDKQPVEDKFAGYQSSDAGDVHGL
jgi:hypothetical protein